MGTHWASDHFVLYETDEERFGGHRRLDGAHNIWYHTLHESCQKREYAIQLYIPSRCTIVLCPYENVAHMQDVPGMPQVTNR